MRTAWVVLGILICLGLSDVVLCEQGTSPVSTLDVEQFEKLSQSLSQAIQEEKSALENIASRNAEFKRIQSVLTAELDSLNLLLSTYVNIANLSSIGLEDLEKVSSNLKGNIARISEHMKEIEEKEAELSELIEKTVEQRNINEQQLKDFKARGLTIPEAQAVIKSLGQLTDLLKKKEKELKKLQASYSGLIEQAKTSVNNGSVLLEKSRKILPERNGKSFSRENNPFLRHFLARVLFRK